MSDKLLEQWKASPQSVELLERWVVQAQQQGQQRQAIAELQSFTAELDAAESASAHVALVSLSLSMGDVSQADSFVNTLHSLQPDSFQPYYFKGLVLQRLNRLERAKEAFGHALKRKPDHPESWLGLVECDARSRDFTGALKTLGEASKLSWPGGWRRAWLYRQGCIFQQMARYPLALVSFAELIGDCVRDGIPPEPQKKSRMSQVPPSAPIAALKDAIGLLEEQGLQPFPTAGTLLGWWREGNFLAHDKDIDVKLPPGSDWEKALAAISAGSAFRVRPNEAGYSNKISYVHIGTGMVVDMSQHEETAGGQVRCIWKIPGVPDEQCRQTLQSAYSLVRDEWLGCKLWRPDDPDRFLTEVYGDWRVPETRFDSVISAHHLVGFPDCVRCYAYNRLANALCEGSLQRGLSYVSQILQKDPLDPVANRFQNVLAGRRDAVAAGAG